MPVTDGTGSRSLLQKTATTVLIAEYIARAVARRLRALATLCALSVGATVRRRLAR